MKTPTKKSTGRKGAGPKQRRTYKIDRFPAHVQAAIFKAYVRGEPYLHIRQRVSQLGHSISIGALSKYWRRVFHSEVDRLRKARALKEVLKEALRLEPDSPSAKLAEELLYDVAIQTLRKTESADPFPYLREAREQAKARPPAAAETRTAAPRSRPTKGASLKQHLDQLYGPGVVVEDPVDAEHTQEAPRK